MFEHMFPRRRPDGETHLLLDGSCLLFDPAQGKGHTLNLAGVLVWGYCDATLTGAEIVQELDALLPQLTAFAPVSGAEAAGAILDATVHNHVSGSELARVAVRLAAQSRRCSRLNNGILEEALDLIQAAALNKLVHRHAGGAI